MYNTHMNKQFPLHFSKVFHRLPLLMVTIFALLVASGTPSMAAETQGAAKETQSGGTGESQGLDKQIQGLKQEVLDLNRDLFVLEEELLFPASTQVAVFLSMDVGEFFQLDSVQLKLDNKVVTNYLYTERENAALLRGGVQRLYMGNLRTGKHELVAVFTGKGTHERDYKRGATLVFEKQTDTKQIELRILDVQKKLQPEFEVKESK
jgi:hypothetical protein